MARYNPNSSRDIKNLRDAMSFSTSKLVPFRQKYVDLIRHYAGDQYGDESVDRMLPMNIIRLATDIWSRMLAANNPRVLVGTSNVGLRPRAHELQLAVDHLLREIRFARAQREVVKSAIFTMGIMKIGLTDAPMGESLSIYHDAGQPFADAVLFSDWIHDTNARRPEEWEFCGNRYRVPLEEVKNNPAFQNTDRLEATDLDTWSGDGNDTRPESISQGGSSASKQEYIDHVELWDIWLPRENLIVTLPADGDSQPLLVTEWDGPERGPFHTLCFGEIPGNIIPAGAVGSLFDIHDLLNRLFVKLGDQAERQKTVGAASQAAASDGTASQIMDLADGEIFSSSHPDAIREVRFGGVDQTGLAFVGWLRGIASYMGGNLDTLGGLQSGADTLGQEKLLVQSSSQMMDDMQNTVENFVKDVVSDLAWWMYTSPELAMPLVKKSQSGRFEMPFEWGPDKREADFFEYSFDITPFSTQPQSPKTKLQFITNLVQQQVLPMAQAGILTQQALQFDAKEYFRLVGQLADMPEVNFLIKSSGGASLPTEPPGVSRMAANTSREYIRRNVGGQSGQQGMDRDVMQGAMGASMPKGTGPSMMPQGA